MFCSNSFFERDVKLMPSSLVAQEEVDNMNEWVETLDADNHYKRNAKVVWTKKYIEYRDLSLMASLVSVYFKNKVEQAKKVEDRKNDFVGNIKDKIKITDIKLVRVLFTKNGSIYNAPDSYVYEIVDADNNTYIWSTQFNIPENVESIEATVKAHNEFKGIRQTVITRGKITTSKPSEDEIKKMQETNNQALKDLNSALEDFY